MNYTLINEVAQLIKDSKNVVVLTGAGMSTESGLKDFRGIDGRWKGVNVYDLASTSSIEPKGSEESLEDYTVRLARFGAFYKHRISEVMVNSPNIGHKIVAKWQSEGRVSSLITQNTDGYHYDAGSPSVLEIHGSLRKLYCNSCGESFSAKWFMVVQEPHWCPCEGCNGIIRPSVVLFDEDLPPSAIKAQEAALESDLMIVVGTSLKVSPANQLPLWAVSNRAKLVIINDSPTSLDKFAQVIVRDRIGDVLQGIDSILSVSV